jgi:hypothetical protein
MKEGKLHWKGYRNREGMTMAGKAKKRDEEDVKNKTSKKAMRYGRERKKKWINRKKTQCVRVRD